MKILHRPIYDTKQAEEMYSKKEGVKVSYVCTSSCNFGTLAMDIFFRETPHPKYGNRYFGIFPQKDADGNYKRATIVNADEIEKRYFYLIEGPDGWEYSQHLHDFRSVGEHFIDGGRAHCRTSENAIVVKAKVLNGKLAKVVDSKTDLV